MFLIVNYKTYPSTSGANAVNFTKTLVDATANRSDITLVVCPQAPDIYRIREQFPAVQIWAQHVDNVAPGRNTGWTSPDTVVMAGANGTLLNHSEHQLAQEIIAPSRDRAQQVGLQCCICIDTPENTQKILSMESAPEFIAFEPPELIGTGKSIVSVDPSVATNFLQQAGQYLGNKILGAGVSTKADIQKATEMGFNGVLISSALTTAADPGQATRTLLEGFPQS